MPATVKNVIAILDRHGQRATYAAVGGVVGLPARSVMSGQAKSATNSWVVAKASGKPTGYSSSQCDPRLSENARVLSSSEELRSWLNQHT